jgi:dihydrodipicolinate synthase/N-acetylneuraminate lyase
MEIPDGEVLRFFREVSSATGDLSLSIYETRRAKKALSLDQHSVIKSELPSYLMIKSNTSTIGTTPEGCAAHVGLGINVFGDEGSLWPALGPHGIVGCCSSVVYYAPELILPLNRALAEKNWPAVNDQAAKVKRLLDYVVETFVVGRDYWDSAMDRLGESRAVCCARASPAAAPTSMPRPRT